MCGSRNCRGGGWGQGRNAKWRSRTQPLESSSAASKLNTLHSWRSISHAILHINFLNTYAKVSQDLRRQGGNIPSSPPLAAPGIFIWGGAVAQGSGGQTSLAGGLGTNSPEAEAVCRHYLHTSTAETINIWKFCTIHLLILDHVSRWGLSDIFGH